MGKNVLQDINGVQALGKQRKGKLFSTQRDRGNLINQVAFELGGEKQSRDKVSVGRLWKLRLNCLCDGS